MWPDIKERLWHWVWRFNYTSNHWIDDSGWWCFTDKFLSTILFKGDTTHLLENSLTYAVCMYCIANTTPRNWLWDMVCRILTSWRPSRNFDAFLLRTRYYNYAAWILKTMPRGSIVQCIYFTTYNLQTNICKRNPQFLQKHVLANDRHITQHFTQYNMSMDSNTGNTVKPMFNQKQTNCAL